MEKTKQVPGSIKNINPGNHLCCIYKTGDDHKNSIIPFIRKGIDTNEKIIYIANIHASDLLQNYLQSDGLDTSPYFEKGQLSILTADKLSVQKSGFDPDGMIELLRSQTTKALTEGYTALRVLSEMSVVFTEDSGNEGLMGFEKKIDLFLTGSPCFTLCLYDRKCFNEEILLDVITAHPLLVIGAQLYENFYFIPHSDSLSNDGGKNTLDHWITHLIERKKAENSLIKSELLLSETGRTAKVGGWEIDLKTQELLWTPEVYRIHEVETSYKPTVAEGVNFYSEASKIIIGQAVQRAIELGEPFDVELDIVTAKGNLRSVHSIGKADKEAAKVFGTFQDITDRKKAENAVKHATEELQALNQQLRAGEQQLRAANQQLKAKEQALLSKMADLEQLNKLMVGRELEMITLKKRVNTLMAASGKQKEFDTV